MMIKIFTTENGKVALTPEELRSLLDEAYWEGYKAHTSTITYTTPNWQPYAWKGDTITLNNTSGEAHNVQNAED